MRKSTKNILSALLLFFLLSAFFGLVPFSKEKVKRISLTQLVREINDGQVKKIVVSGDNLKITYNNGKLARAKKEPQAALSQSLVNYGVDKDQLSRVAVETVEEGSAWTLVGSFFFSVLPVLLLIFLFWIIFRQTRTGAAQVFNFTKAKARLFGPYISQEKRITFADIGGLKEAKEELREVIDFLKFPRKYLQMGARIPRGVLLIGPPGTGKTMLAKAVANESNVPFFSISGSEFIEMFVGVGAGRIRSLFEQARRAKKAIIFIDEIDSIGKVRGIGMTGGEQEREQTLNQLLAEMDGIGRGEGLIVMGATNRPEYLDPALLRPGRFDRRIVLDLPDINEREEILKIHCRGKPLADDVKIREIAERTPGFSGADLANVVNEAAILAARRNKKQIFQGEFLESIEKVLLGPERRSHVLTVKEKERAAYHEAGHALIISVLMKEEPVRKVSIISRGLAAGYTLKVPTEERKIKTKSEFLAEIAALLGGYCAEKVKFGEISTGAADDLRKASDLARRLVKEYGMSSLGPIAWGERENLVFLGREVGERRNYSEKLAEKIDKEVEKFVWEGEKKARSVLLKRKKVLEAIAKRLIEKETIEKEEFDQLIKSQSGAKKKKGGKKSVEVEIKKL